MGSSWAWLLILFSGSRLCDAAFGEERVYPVDLEWKDVSCSIGKKQILSGVSGKASAGKLLAVMGPSGSGKTTLLNALAGQVPYGKKTQLHGILTVGGATREEEQDQAYVKQEDVFYSQLTVKETLMMAARLRLPRSMSLADKTVLVDELINKLGLSKAADTIVGDEKTRGISGGERKRLSIACQLFGTPSMIFCDEPTTGLDSFQAERVMSTLRQLAEEGHTIICSIHQPRSSIYRMFDDLVVLSEGQVMFHGPAGKVAGHFRAKGHAMPANTNPGEFAIDVVSIDYTSKEAEEESKQRIALFASEYDTPPSSTSSLLSWKHTSSSSSDENYHPERSGHARIASISAPPSGGANKGSPAENVGGRQLSTLSGSAMKNQAVAMGAHGRRRGRRPGQGHGRGLVRRQRAGFVEQFRLLLARSWRQVNRAKFANITRVVANLGSGIVFGCIFWQLGLGQSHIQDRVGLLQTAAIQCAMSTVAKSLVTFPTESAIVKAERSLNMYSVLPYFLSKMIAELPISAFFPSVFGVLLYQMTGLHPKRDRMLKFLGVITIEAFAASALGMLVGCVAKDGDAASAIGPPIMTIFILFSGFYISQDNVPRVLRWVKDASLIRYAFEALCVNELQGLEFECDTKTRGPCIRTGEEMLARVAFNESTVKGATLGLSKILGSCWALTYLALVFSKPRFQPMVDPSALRTDEVSGSIVSSGDVATTITGGSGGVVDRRKSNSLLKGPRRSRKGVDVRDAEASNMSSVVETAEADAASLVVSDESRSGKSRKPSCRGDDYARGKGLLGVWRRIRIGKRLNRGRGPSRGRPSGASEPPAAGRTAVAGTMGYVGSVAGKRRGSEPKMRVPLVPTAGKM